MIFMQTREHSSKSRFQRNAQKMNEIIPIVPLQIITENHIVCN
jgi:hypothetical protein